MGEGERVDATIIHIIIANMETRINIMNVIIIIIIITKEGWKQRKRGM
tara:strand:- start:265 stop:408 length:144 start_codon:yes stop_codon:yes gene_type:complete